MKRWKRSMRISALSLVLVILSACGGQPAQPQQSAALPSGISDFAVTSTAATAGIPSSPGRIMLNEEIPPLTAEQIFPLVEKPMLDWDKLGITGNPERMEIDPNGNIYVQESIYAPRENEPGKYTRVQNNIVKVSADGDRLWSIEMPINVFTFCGDANGLWVLYRDENQLAFYNGNGQEEKRIELTGIQIGIQNGISYADGYICVQYFIGEDFAQSKYAIVDTRTGEIRQYDVVDPRPDYSEFVIDIFPCEGPYFCTLREVTGPIKPMVIANRETFVDIIDARTGEVVETIQLRDKDRNNMQIIGAQQIVYSPKEKRFYFRGEYIEETVTRRMIYSQARGSEYAEEIAEIPALMYLSTPFNLLGDELLFFEAVQMKTFTIDKNYRATDRQPLVVQGPVGSDASMLFSQQNPGWEVKGSETDEDNTALLLRQDSSVDVYYMNDLVADISSPYPNSNYADIDSLVQKGYYVDLSKSQIIRENINSMYPVFRDSVTDGKKLWGYPVDYSYERLYVNAGYTGTVPTTWAQLKELLNQDSKLLSSSIGYAQKLMIQQADVSGINMNAAGRTALWQSVLDDLSAYNTVLPKTGSGKLNASDTMAFNYPIQMDPNEVIPLGQFRPLPALDTATAGRTQLEYNGYFVVNPYGKNIDKAIAFIEAFVQAQTQTLALYGNEGMPYLTPTLPPDNDSKVFFDAMMKDAYIYHTPSYYKNLNNIVTSYLEGQLTRDAALEEIENIYRLAQRG